MNYQDCCMIPNYMKVMKTFALRYKMKGSCICLCSRQWTTNERCYLYFLLNNQSICRWRQHNCCWNLSILLEYVHVKDKSDHYVVPLYSRWSCWEGNDRKLIVVFVMVWYFFCSCFVNNLFQYGDLSRTPFIVLCIYLFSTW